MDIDLHNRSLELSRGLLSHLEKKLAELDRDPDQEVERYTADLKQYFADLSPVRIPTRQFEAELADSDVVFVGDFATSASPKRVVERLVRTMLEPMLALNFASVAHQEDLDRYAAHEVSAAELERRTGFRKERAAYAWPLYRKALSSARKARVPLFLFEPDFNPGLARKDEDSALVLDVVLHSYVPRPLIVLVGELRASVGGLPAHLGRVSPDLRTASVLVDSAPVFFWDREQGGTGRGCFRLRPGLFAVNRQTPHSKLLSFLSWHLLGDEPVSPQGLSRRFRSSMRAVADGLGLPHQTVPNRLQVFEPGDPGFLPTAHQRSALTPEEVCFLEQRILAGESRTLPDRDLVYLGNLSRTHVAEEAAHLFRGLTGGFDCSRDGEDAFWSVAIHEACGFLGSRFVVPNREIPSPAALSALGDLDTEAMAHMMGYKLGARLHDRFHKPAVRSFARVLFWKDLVEPGAAKALYFGGLNLVASRIG